MHRFFNRLRTTAPRYSKPGGRSRRNLDISPALVKKTIVIDIVL
jgi:hypothetical protein